MVVYDTARKLASELKASEEYQAYDKAREAAM
ncbi:MAG TPA: YlbF family regulator, partial [Candidatus Aphodomorpha intestinavium]|nr:YlbF family regulator [Candidatus Aphodomorpha intestinavium]